MPVADCGAERIDKIISIARHCRPGVVLMAADDLESLRETLFWLSQPDIREDVAEAEADIANGRTIGSDRLRGDLGLPGG